MSKRSAFEAYVGGHSDDPVSWLSNKGQAPSAPSRDSFEVTRAFASHLNGDEMVASLSHE